MGTGGLFGGRSRHATRKGRSHHSSTAPPGPRRRREDEEGTEVQKPDVDELRRRRAEYYSLTDAERRRRSTSTTIRTKSKTSAVSSSRSATTADRRHKEKKHRSSSEKAAKADKAERIKRPISESQRRTEEYVYGSRPPDGLESIDEEPTGNEQEHGPSERRRPKRPSASRRHSVPTVFDSEVTPDDSISQVAERDISSGSSRRPPKAYVRPSLKRTSTASTRLERVTEVSDEAASVASSKRHSRQEPSTLGSMFRRNSTASALSPPRLVDCLTCGSDDVPSHKSAKLACGHRMCHDCLKRIFEMSVKDPAHMPPKCCTDQHIPLKHVDKLFDLKFKMLWNRKYQEYHTKNRIYCPTLKCGEWIKPSHIHTSQGRKYALCPRCKTKVCTLCNNKMHRSSDCPKDPEIAKLVEQAKEKGWQRCYSCNAFVEKREGCNHMTCRCMAEFCIVCGSKWKTCDCPWFNYSNLPNPDRLNDMRVPEPIQVMYRQVFRAAADAIPAPAPLPGAARGPPPEVTYQQEMDQRRRQERLDADLARRLQLASLMDPDDEPRGHRGADPDIWGLGNAARHFMNDDFVQNAANVVMNAFGDTNLGRRGDRSSGRRRRPRPTAQNDDDPGLAPNFLGDESLLGSGPVRRP